MQTLYVSLQLFPGKIHRIRKNNIAMNIKPYFALQTMIRFLHDLKLT